MGYRTHSGSVCARLHCLFGVGMRICLDGFQTMRKERGSNNTKRIVNVILVFEEDFNAIGFIMVHISPSLCLLTIGISILWMVMETNQVKLSTEGIIGCVIIFIRE